MDKQTRQQINVAGRFFWLEECEEAYRLGGKNVTSDDYLYDWYKALSQDEKCDQTNYWDFDKFYADFELWWVSLPFEEKERIYYAIYS